MSENHSRKDAALSFNDASHRLDMEQGSRLLAFRVNRFLAERQALLDATIRRNEQAKEAIRRGVRGDVVREAFNLSPTAYKQLAGQVRA